MNTHLPIPPDRYSALWFSQLMQQLRQLFGSAISQDEETPRVVLRSPNGTNYDLTVSDAGVLVVTATSKTRA